MCCIGTYGSQSVNRSLEKTVETLQKFRGILGKNWENVDIQGVPSCYLDLQIVITQEQKTIQCKIIQQKIRENYVILCNINFIWK